MEKPALSIVIPCFNEQQRIETAFAGALSAIESSKVTAEVIIVDDGSTDHTLRQGLDLCDTDERFTIISRPHAGKGAAIREGVKLCKGDIVFTADADWSMPPEQIVRFLERFKQDPRAQVVISSREIEGAVRYEEPLRRHIVGRAFNIFVRAVILEGIQDSQCGFKAYRSDAAKRLFSALTTDGWAFDVEILARAKKLQLNVEEIPIDWTYDGDTRLNTLSDAITMTLAVIRLKCKLLQD